MVRLILAAFSAVVGLVCAALSLSALSVVGADDVAETAPSQVRDGAYAFVLNPQLVPFQNTEATLQVSGDADLFMGTASGVDVDSYLTGVAHEEVTEVDIPQALQTRFIDGEPAPLNDAAGRDWWTASQTGRQLSHTFDLDAESGEVLVVAPAEPEGNLDGVDVQLKMDAGAVFPVSLIGLAIAILAFGAAGYFLLRWLDARPGRRRRLRREYGRGWSGRGGSSGSGMSDLGARAKDLVGRTAASATRATTRKNRSQRLAQQVRAAAAVGSVVTLGVLAGCAPLPMAQPSSPNLTEFERPALRAGEAGAFLTSYTERLDESLKGDEDRLDKIQAPPLLDRTRAEVLIAEAGKTELSAVNFEQIVAGGPSFGEYPMWFIAFGKPAGSDETVQAMLVTRESAGEDWRVTQSLFVPQENVPTLVADGTGAVEQSGTEFTELGTTANETLQQYLETGEISENDQNIEYASDAFTGFRDYVDEMAGNDEAFEDITVTCDPYDEATVPLAEHGLKTETGDVSFGEVRCAIELKVRSGGSIDVGEELEAVMTGDLDGGRLIISTSIPYMLLGSEQTNLIVGSDWFLLEAQTTD